MKLLGLTHCLSLLDDDWSLAHLSQLDVPVELPVDGHAVDYGGHLREQRLVRGHLDLQRHQGHMAPRRLLWQHGHRHTGLLGWLLPAHLAAALLGW